MVHKKTKNVPIHRSYVSLKRSVLIQGDAADVLTLLPSNSVNCVITSPPYWGMRDYDYNGQIGLEKTLVEYIKKLIRVFDQVKRVLNDKGIFWLNIGDGHTSGNRRWRAADKKNHKRAMSIRPDNPEGLKNKDLIGIPWRIAFALQEAGWYLRSDIIWHKPNAQPESVKDRPTKSHEYLFMFSKSEYYKYYYKDASESPNGEPRNRRTVWTINTERLNRYSHLAPFPEDLIEPCINSSTKKGEYILDPFFGSGTVGLVAKKMKRNFIGIELYPEYSKIARKRLDLENDDIIQLKEKAIKFKI
jgi:site-specific DNA-methyltransferase (cytosine-N4-specific)